jgi:2-furoyl-CoA dehydrogenase large subunit
MGAPAAVSNAVNDAVRGLGISFSKLPIRISAISDAVASAKQK